MVCNWYVTVPVFYPSCRDVEITAQQRPLISHYGSVLVKMTQGVIQGAGAAATWRSAPAEGEGNYNMAVHTADCTTCFVGEGPGYTRDT